MQRIGVFICWCGSNIAATVDVQKVADVIKAEPNVVFSETYQYMCSENGQQLIKKAIKELHYDNEDDFYSHIAAGGSAQSKVIGVLIKYFTEEEQKKKDHPDRYLRGAGADPCAAGGRRDIL